MESKGIELNIKKGLKPTHLSISLIMRMQKTGYKSRYFLIEIKEKNTVWE